MPLSIQEEGFLIDHLHYKIIKYDSGSEVIYFLLQDREIGRFDSFNELKTYLYIEMKKTENMIKKLTEENFEEIMNPDNWISMYSSSNIKQTHYFGRDRISFYYVEVVADKYYFKVCYSRDKRLEMIEFNSQKEKTFDTLEEVKTYVWIKMKSGELD